MRDQSYGKADSKNIWGISVCIVYKERHLSRILE